MRQAIGSRLITATTRNPDRSQELIELGVEPLVLEKDSVEQVSHVANGSDVLVSFPPGGHSDSLLAPACAGARSIVYISSTAVYGKKTGTIDDTTATDSSDARAELRLTAEAVWSKQHATVLRAPGIYGPDSGLHLRLLKGNYRLPAQGQNKTSRIHIEDLSRIILAVFSAGNLADQIYLVGDDYPCTQSEIISWLCNRLKIPMPDLAPIGEVGPILKADRAVDSRRIREKLGITLNYPNYECGYEACISRLTTP
jgi:nucleoside-diphosphate-sugar epimerase